MSRAVVTLGLSIWLAAAAEARAEPPAGDAAAVAQALYDAARELMVQGRFDEACPKLEEARSLAPTAVGAKLRLAECYEGQGRAASAWAMYVAAESAARAAGQVDRARAAGERASAIEPRRSRLTIVVPTEVRALDGLAIERDGVMVGPGQWGQAIPVDGGDHRVLARATGKAHWEATLTVPREKGDAKITVGPLLDLPLPLPLPPPSPSPPPQPRRVPAWVWITGATGLALGALGAAFGADCVIVGARQADLCGPDLDRCERARPAYDPAADNARRARGYGLFLGFSSAGLGAVVASVAGLAMHARGTSARSSVSVAPWIAGGTMGIALGGRF